MRLLYTLVSAIIVLGISSCSSNKALYIRTPDKVNAPCLTKKNDLKLDVSVSLQNKGAGGSPVSVSADAAYALSDNFGVIASYRGVNSYSVVHEWYRWDIWSRPDTIERQDFMLRGGRFEGGVGGFQQIEKDLGMEGYVGFGLGNIRNASASVTPGPYTIAYSSFFIQYGVFYFYKHFSISTGFKWLRINNYKFGHDNNPYLDQNGYAYDPEDVFIYFTPYVQLQGGTEAVKLSLQCGYEGRYSHLYDGVDYRPSPMYVSVGITVQPSLKWFKSQPVKSQHSTLPGKATRNIL